MKHPFRIGERNPALDIVSYGRRGTERPLHFTRAQIAQIARTVYRAPEVMVKASGGANTTHGVVAHFSYIGRRGELEIETDDGERLQGKEVAAQLVEDWDLDLDAPRDNWDSMERGGRRNPKLVHNIILSMPSSTPPARLLAASRDFAREEFALNHRYAMVLHTDQAHPHVHLVISAHTMYQGVQSHDRLAVFNNVQILAKAAKLFAIPTVISTVAAKTFSGPFMPEVADLFPSHRIIDRTSMNSWLDANFRDAVHATGRKKLVVAGLWTEACVLFPTIDLLREGFEVYVPADACGDVTPEAHQRSMDRLAQAGAVPITSLQFVFELQQDWARQATYNGVMEILKAHSPYGIQVRYSKWALGEHASEAG